jgi:hypothetical protein
MQAQEDEDSLPDIFFSDALFLNRVLLDAFMKNQHIRKQRGFTTEVRKFWKSGSM